VAGPLPCSSNPYGPAPTAQRHLRCIPPFSSDGPVRLVLPARCSARCPAKRLSKVYSACPVHAPGPNKRAYLAHSSHGKAQPRRPPPPPRLHVFVFTTRSVGGCVRRRLSKALEVGRLGIRVLVAPGPALLTGLVFRREAGQGGGTPSARTLWGAAFGQRDPRAHGHPPHQRISTSPRCLGAPARVPASYSSGHDDDQGGAALAALLSLAPGMRPTTCTTLFQWVSERRLEARWHPRMRYRSR
jgi:hypothetical protein